MFWAACTGTLDDHISVAVGRDYADVSPMDGVVLGSGGQKLTIEVDVVPVLDPSRIPSA